MKIACQTWIGLLVGLSISTQIFADTDRSQQVALSANEVLTASARHFPAILESLARQRGAYGKLAEAQGSFDLVFETEGMSRMSGFYNGTYVESGVKQNLRPLGATVYGGYRSSQGRFPIYEDKSFTNTGGELSVGVLFSLLRDRQIDERRFQESDARLAIEQADLDVLLTQVGVQRRALIAYWTWVVAGHKHEVYADLLRIALNREGGLKEQVDRGARARIFLTENRQNITRRQSLTKEAERDWVMAANALSLYLRNEDGTTRVPDLGRLPAASSLVALEQFEPQTEAVLSEALARRPELAMLKTALQRASRKIALRKNDLKPRLDLSLEVANDYGAIAEGGRSREETDTIIGLQFSVPLQRRKARGKLQQAEADADAYGLELRQRAEEIEIETRNILLDLAVAQELVVLAQQEYEQSETLMRAEQERFSSGASDFFLVNIREETAANARVKYYLAGFDTRVARVNFDAATVNLVELGVDSPR